MKVGEVIQRIQSLYSKGVQSADSRLTDPHIYSKAISVRAKLISQEAKKRQLVNQFNYQRLSCMELIPAQPYECSCIPALGQEMYRSKYKIPKPLTDLDKHLFQSITSLDGFMKFDMAKWEGRSYKEFNKFTSKRRVAILEGGYIWVMAEANPTAINAIGLFEDPIEAAMFPSYCCNDNQPSCMEASDYEFYLDADMLDTLVQLASEELLKDFSAGMEDETSNSLDDSSKNSK